MKNLKWGNKLVYTLTSAGARKYWAVEGGEPPVPVFDNSFTAVFNQEMSRFPVFYFNDGSEPFIREPINSTTCKYKIPENKKFLSLTGTFESIGSLTSIDFTNMDTTAIGYFDYAFYNAASLTTIVGLDVNSAIYGKGDLNYMFYNCTSLKNLDMRNIHLSLDLWYVKLERDAVVNIFNNLISPTSALHNPYVRLSSYSSNKITAEDKKIATDKGWRVTI